MVNAQRVGSLHSIETLGTVDGGGIRFVIFLQGCAMRCEFCHNPDTWLKNGQQITVAELMAQILDYRVYYEASGGGVTVSGGEPLLQSDFVMALFSECGREGIHRVLDTSGYCRHGKFQHVLGETERVLFSIKVINNQKHIALTSVGNEMILANLHLAAASSTELVIRYVLIPGINDQDHDLRDLIGVIRDLGSNLEVDVLPYHRMGIAKWEQLGLEYSLKGIPEPTPLEIEHVRNRLADAQIKLTRYS